jgi:hypothetical protein
MTCGESYRLHYIEKIRPKVHSAALVFGSAIDAALNVLLVPDGRDPEALFEKTFTETDINGVQVYVPTYADLVYQTNDFDPDLLTEIDYQIIEEKFKETHPARNTAYLEIYQALKKRKSESGFDSLDNTEKALFNLINWLCMRRKGLLMLQAYRKKVLPKIEKVHATQKYVALTNSEGDSVVGYVDLIADIKDIGTVILDNKTASMEYDKDSVLTSPQLSLYVHMLEAEYNTRKAGYIVMRKTIIKNRKKVCNKCGHDGSGGRHKTCDAIVDNKRCNGEWTETIDPDVYIQFITDTIPEQTEKIVLENMDTANEAIKSGHFTRNFNSCHNFYGSRCPYFQKCYYGNDKDLIDMKKEKK